MPAFTVSDSAVPPSLHGPVLVDAHGQIRYWSTVESHLALAHLRSSTVGIHLSAGPGLTARRSEAELARYTAIVRLAAGDRIKGMVLPRTPVEATTPDLAQAA